jgi:predicted permease
MTALAELDLARQGRTASRWATVRTTARQAVIHPVVLPLLMGMAWNATGWGLHPALDEALLGLSRAVVPVCLLLIGVNLAQYGLRGRMRGALGTGVLKLFVLPACVLLFAHTVVHLSGMDLAVVLLMAALPTGSNALIFAHRYRTLEAEATAAIVLTTVAYAATASLWLWVLGQFFP